uniref:Putative ovule protein n=1 Tax=Solanum chacoense TaxID=4108 RepID=A0A0V0HRV6_SOLCH
MFIMFPSTEMLRLSFCSFPSSDCFLLIAGSFSESEADPFHGFAAHGRSPHHLSTPLNPFEPHRAVSAPFSEVERLKTWLKLQTNLSFLEVSIENPCNLSRRTPS